MVSQMFVFVLNFFLLIFLFLSFQIIFQVNFSWGVADLTSNQTDELLWKNSPPPQSFGETTTYWTIILAYNIFYIHTYAAMSILLFNMPSLSLTVNHLRVLIRHFTSHMLWRIRVYKYSWWWQTRLLNIKAKPLQRLDACVLSVA